MKFAKISIIFLLLVLLMGAVSAADEITDNALIKDNSIELDDDTNDVTRLKNTKNDEFNENEINTFTDFSKDMNESVNVMDLKHNYKFNNKTDKGPIVIDKNNFIIEGNNFILDGNNQTNIFAIKGSNITINNLIFTNGNCKFGGLLDFYGGGAIISYGSITLNNVTFINNTAVYSGGDILISQGQLNCFDCKFIDSYSVKGSSIYSTIGSVNIERCTFTSKYTSKWSTILAGNSKVFINDCIFNNISSDYAPAIYVSGGNVIINNSKFNNLKAYKT